MILRYGIYTVAKRPGTLLKWLQVGLINGGYFIAPICYNKILSAVLVPKREPILKLAWVPYSAFQTCFSQTAIVSAKRMLCKDAINILVCVLCLWLPSGGQRDVELKKLILKALYKFISFLFKHKGKRFYFAPINGCWWRWLFRFEDSNKENTLFFCAIFCEIVKKNLYSRIFTQDKADSSNRHKKVEQMPNFRFWTFAEIEIQRRNRRLKCFNCPYVRSSLWLWSTVATLSGEHRLSHALATMG